MRKRRSQILKWADSISENWSYRIENQETELVLFQLTSVPNFAEPRFMELGGTLEERRTEMARRQLQMLRQLHSFGDDCTLCLRLTKFQDKLKLFVLLRTVAHDNLDGSRFARQVQMTFPKEYAIAHVGYEDVSTWTQATDLSHTKFIDVLLKPEERLEANTWPYFYVTSLWQGQATHDLETVCRALLQFQGEATIDMTMVPATFGRNERAWVDQCVKVMRQALTGERLTSSDDGRLLKTFDPMPGLRLPVENYENLMKRYDQSRLFLYSFRILASNDPFSITQALASTATRSKPQILRLRAGEPDFEEEYQATTEINVTPKVRASWWNSAEPLPFRAQRLHRLADIDEVASFWRLPIPVRPGFPGFDLDIGGHKGVGRARGRRTQTVNLGTFTDDAAIKNAVATFNVQGLAKHGLIVGVPGSGKTTTMFNILHQLWVTPDSADSIPFIVLEPAKTEYRALKTISEFKDDLLVFTLGDERTSPFRFNPFEVPNGIPVESHISRLNACFAGAFNLFDPLPLLLDKAIRQTYEVNGWYDDSIGGEAGLIIPTLSDLCQQAEIVINNSGYSDKLRDDFNAALLQRLESLRRGSKGRMLDTRLSISFDELMNRPVIMELDSLNEDEKALIMMFILTFVYEYAKANRRSGSPLRHVLIVEEAHNLIGRGSGSGSEFRANPRDLAIRLFTRMLAEMRALGQGILIADQLPTALAPEAVKQTNLKVLMRMTARDDREEIGNTMDLDEAALKAVTRFKSGQALVYLEEWDRVRQIQTPNFKGIHAVEEPADDSSLSHQMAQIEAESPNIFMPFPECPFGCTKCNRRVRSQAERLVRPLLQSGVRNIAFAVKDNNPLYDSGCKAFKAKAVREALLLKNKLSFVDSRFPFCAYVHYINWGTNIVTACRQEQSACTCKTNGHDIWLEEMIRIGERIQTVE